MVDFHPIFVHFPIALLTVYALLECVRFKTFLKQPWLVPTKTVLLIVGVLGALASLATGEGAEAAYRGTPTRHLVGVHSTFAAATTWVFGIIAALYLIVIAAQHIRALKKQSWFTPLARLASWATGTWYVIVPLALIGLVLVTITGALGGAIVYGTTADPVIAFVTTTLGVA